MKWTGSIWLKKLIEKGRHSFDRDVLTFAFFLLLSFIFWYLNSLQKDVEYNIKYPVRYINLPEERVLVEDLPAKLDLYLKGPGYAIVKLKLAGNRSPVILDISTISYRRVPGSRTLSYYIITTGLIPKVRNQLRAECDITAIRPDTLFFTFDRIISKIVKIVPDVDVETERQYLLKGNIFAEPDTVTIIGPKSVLDTINSIRTRHKKLKGISQTITRVITLAPAKNYSISNRKTTITIPVEQFTEADVKVPVTILNCPDSIDVRIFPDVVTVKFMVSVSDYKKINEIPFKVIVDVSKSDLSTALKLPVEIANTPDFLNSIRVSPSEVDYLIEKISE